MKSSTFVTDSRPAPRRAAVGLVRLRPVPSLPAGTVTRTGLRKAMVLAACSTSLFLTGLDNTAVNVGLPAINTELHASVAGLQWVVAGYTITLASLLMLAGALADRIGRRIVFQVGLAMFTLGSWLCSLAPSLDWLVAFRVLQAVGGSMLNPAALGIITNTFARPAERAKAIGIWDAVFGLSMALGPLIGGLLVGSVGWRGIFWANIPVGLAAVALTAVFVPDSRARRARRVDPAGQILVIAALATLAFAIIQGPGSGWSSPGVVGASAGFTLAFGLLLAFEPRHAEPLVDLRLFRDLRFAALSLAAVCVTAALAGWLFLTTLYLQDVRGESAAMAGLTILPMPVAMAVCAALAGRVLARRGPRGPLAVAGILLAASCTVLSRLDPATGPGILLAAYSLFGAGFGIASASVTNGIMSSVPKSQASVASGINSASRQLGTSLGVAVVGSVLASSLHGGIHADFLQAAPASWWVLACCGAVVLRLGLATASRGRRASGAAPFRTGGTDSR